MGKYNLSLSQAYNMHIERELMEQGVNVRFYDDFLPDFLIVETEEPEKLDALQFVIKYEETRIGQLLVLPKNTKKTLLRVEPSPYIDTTILSREGLHGLGVKIGVIDSGFEESWCGKVKEAKDFTTGLSPIDPIGHGSIVISLIKKYATVAEIYSAKVCEEDDFIDEESVFRALRWMREIEGLKIINMSIGFKAECPGNCRLSDVIKKMATLGYTIIAAAGNDGTHTCYCPACSDGAITIGGLNDDGNKVATFSSKGHINSTKPDLVAPAHGVMSFVEGAASPYNGTSFAAPLVTGITAACSPLIRDKAKIKHFLIESSQPLLDEPVRRQGSGKLSLQQLLEVVKYDNQTYSANT